MSWSSPEELKRQAEEFDARVKKDTGKIRKLFEQACLEGSEVTEVGDLVWWPQTDATLVLAGVRLADGRCLALGYNGTSFSEPEPGKWSWMIKNINQVPSVTLDDDHMAVGVTPERYLMVEHGCPSEEYRLGTPPRRRWRYTGVGSSGSTALKEFAKHGITFSADTTTRD